MNTEAISRLLMNLGSTHSALIENKVIPQTPLKLIYVDDDALGIDLAPGVELVFSPCTKSLETINILIKNSWEGTEPIFDGKLPEPYKGILNRADALVKLGSPAISKTPIELRGSRLHAWDLYQLDNSLHPAAFIELQYIKDMDLKAISISLMDRTS